MATKNYQCKHCATLVQKDSTPTASGCPSAAFHRWRDLGEVGPTAYLCKHCGAKVNAKSTPNTSDCPSSTFHSWTKL